MAIFKGLSNSSVIKFYGVQYDSFKDTAIQMNWYSNLEKSGSGKWWALRNKQNDFLGAIGFNDWNTEHQKAEVGFWLLPQFWGNGLIAEAAEKVFTYMQNKLKIHRIEAYVELENEQSARLLKKLGFELEGVMKDSEVKNDKYISISIFSLINNQNDNH